MRIAIINAFILGVFWALGQSTLPVNASATVSPKIIDGNIADWTTGSLRNYDSGLKLSYEIANDQDNMYLVFQLDHSLGIRQLTHAGLQVSLEPTGKNKRKTLIVFQDTRPMFPDKKRPVKDSMFSSPDSLSRPITGAIGTSGPNEHPESFVFETSGFVGDNGRHVQTDSLPIKAACKWDEQGNVTIELVIPLTEFAEDAANIPLLFSKKMNLGLSMNVIQGRQQEGGMPGGNGGSGLRGGGGMHGPPGDGAGSGRPMGQPHGDGQERPTGNSNNNGGNVVRQTVSRKLQLKKI